jgi:fructosamine-3-kinase
VTRDDIVERIGPIDEPYRILTGGRANANIRIGSDRLLRIYRRNPDALEKEAGLLSRTWQHLRVPEIIERGNDFLELEYVEHGPLQASRAHGWAIGQALAEIHQNTFAKSGHLGSDGRTVSNPFAEFADAIRTHVASLSDVPDECRKSVTTVLDAQRDHLNRLADSPVLLHGDFKVSNLHWPAEPRPLVLDWEFAWAGPALADVGQLFRWEPPELFRNSFAEAYRSNGGQLPTDWRRSAALLDLVNLAGLLNGAPRDSRRFQDITTRIQESLDAL